VSVGVRDRVAAGRLALAFERRVAHGDGQSRAQRLQDEENTMLSDFQSYPTIPASDLERARGFYEGKLGLVVDEVTAAGVTYRAKGSTLFLYESTFAGTNKATTAGFRVTDLPGTVAALKARGVRFEEYDFPGFATVDGIARTPGGSAAWFKDTEGNIIGLVQID
jgi:catechol 2,3-dioxygenase-like lactoylglutathione lyase family enzyme